MTSVGLEPAFAGRLARVSAGLVDLALPLSGLTLVNLLSGASGLLGGSLPRYFAYLRYPVLLGIWLWNCGYLQSLTGQSIGKKLCSLHLVKADGTAIGNLAWARAAGDGVLMLLCYVPFFIDRMVGVADLTGGRLLDRALRCKVEQVYS
jgi:uncharacterized RDD family membrane protein YckC